MSTMFLCGLGQMIGIVDRIGVPVLVAFHRVDGQIAFTCAFFDISGIVIVYCRIGNSDRSIFGNLKLDFLLPDVQLSQAILHDNVKGTGSSDFLAGTRCAAIQKQGFIHCEILGCKGCDLMISSGDGNGQLGCVLVTVLVGQGIGKGIRQRRFILCPGQSHDLDVGLVQGIGVGPIGLDGQGAVLALYCCRPFCRYLIASFCSCFAASGNVRHAGAVGAHGILAALVIRIVSANALDDIAAGRNLHVVQGIAFLHAVPVIPGISHIVHDIDLDGSGIVCDAILTLIGDDNGKLMGSLERIVATLHFRCVRMFLSSVAQSVLVLQFPGTILVVDKAHDLERAHRDTVGINVRDRGTFHHLAVLYDLNTVNCHRIETIMGRNGHGRLSRGGNATHPGLAAIRKASLVDHKRLFRHLSVDCMP